MDELLKPYFKAGVVEAGCDEAGRGCLAGPVFAAAVVLPNDFNNKLLNDSKKLSEKNRVALRELIYEEALDFAIAHYSPQQIDEVNILNASIFAMHKAIEQLKTVPAHLIIDGNRFRPYSDIPYSTVIKGDGKYFSIAAASILAKTCRDDYMAKLHEEFPMYNWDKNKGYPTKTHRAAIKKHGISPFHRKSFRLLDEQMKLDL